MTKIIINLPKELDSLELIPLADLHYGDPLCDIELLKERIDYIKSKDNVYCILNGDLINNATKNSISDVYSEIKTPQQQLEELCSLFEPIKDKIIGVVPGNHEMRTYKMDGIDLTKIFCFNLGIADKYAGEAALIFLRLGDTGAKYRNRPARYVIYATHGAGGGIKEGTKINKLAEMASIIDADIYIHSHTHLPAIIKQGFYRINTSTDSYQIVNKLFINTGANLNYGGYGEVAGFKPSSKDTPKILLDGRRQRMKAVL